MALPVSNLFDLSKAITSTFNKSFYRLNSEYLAALQQLEQWSELEHAKILQQYQEREKALQISFEVMTKDYSDQFQKQIRDYEKLPSKKSKNGAVVTYLTAKFTSISADLQNKVIQIFQHQTKQIIKNGAKASPNKSPPPVTTNAPLKSEAQPTIKPGTTVKSQIIQIKSAAQMTGKENAPFKSEIQPVKSNTNVKSEPVQVKPAVEKAETKSVPSKYELRSTTADTTVKSEPAQSKPATKQMEVKSAVASNTQVPMAPSTSATATNPGVSLDRSGLSSILTEPSKITTPLTSSVTSSPPKSSASDSSESLPKNAQPASLVVNADLTPLPERDYISMAHIGCEEIAILYKADDNNSACVIQTLGEDLSLSSSKAKETKIPISNVQGFCWILSRRRYVFMSPDALYLYDEKKSTEIHRVPILVGVGQAVACNHSYIVCKTQTALLFYEIELKKIYNTWNSRSMELERFHSVDILRSIVGLCSPTMCRFYRIIHGDQCKPILLMDIPRGGYNLSLYSVSEDLLVVRFLLVDNTKSRLNMYEKGECRQTVNVINPLTCCALRKTRPHTGPAFFLGNKPHRIEKIHMKIPF